MEIKQKNITASGIKFLVEDGGREVARAYLYIMHNDLHIRPFGFMEDVYVDESLRGKGLGTQLVEKVLEAARRENCYKLIANSRHGREKLHELYKKIGFNDWGIEFRIDLR